MSIAVCPLVAQVDVGINVASLVDDEQVIAAAWLYLAEQRLFNQGLTGPLVESGDTDNAFGLWL
jgi:hypothetical protein